MKTSRTLSLAMVIGGLAALAMTTPPLVACSVLLDSESAQCRTDADCTKFNAASKTYRCVQNGCSADGAVAARECSKNEECIAKLGDFSICRKTDFTCAKLLTADCTKVLGKDNWKNDNAVILGSILPTIGADKSGGIPLENAIEVAISDFTQGAQGLPPGGGVTARRPIAVVSCSEGAEDEADDQPPVRSATHLAGLGVPAIVGASFSGNTQRAANVTIPAGVLLMSPTATSVAITSLDDKNLVWRTSPSDVIQVQALIGAMAEVDTLSRTRWGLAANDPLRVWIFHKSDSYGKGLAEALEKGLVFNGKPALENGENFKRLDYGDADTNDPPPSYPAQAATAAAAVADGKPPHVVFLMGTNESVTEMMRLLEADTGPAWGPDLKKRPTYLFADGGLVTDLWDTINAVPDELKRESLRTRIFGTVPGTTSVNYTSFVSLYQSRFPDGTATVGGTANAYDALYLISLAIAASGDKPTTGANIAEGLKRLVSGQPFTPGSTGINQAFQQLAAGANINYDGASGPLDFDLTTGEAVSDIQVWCVPKQGNQAVPAVPSGVFYDSKAKVVTKGLEAAAVTKCQYPPL